MLLKSVFPSGRDSLKAALSAPTSKLYEKRKKPGNKKEEEMSTNPYNWEE